MWDYEWDGENRLKAMSMRPEVALVALPSPAGGVWVRLEFGYDWMGRRISKTFLKGISDPQAIIDAKGAQLAVWSGMWCEKYVYEPGSWNVSMSYFADIDTADYLSPSQSFAWGPDLSGSTGGAGGIGGLAAYNDDDAGNPTAGLGAMVPIYDGNGNVVRMHTVDFTEGTSVMAAYEFGPFGEVRSINGPHGHRNPIRWSTKWTDAETGLVYYGYRYYAPGVGRWCSRDPLKEVGGVNTSAFTGNDPISGFDAFGLWTSNGDWSMSSPDNYIGSVTAGCGGTLPHLAYLITGQRSDAILLDAVSPVTQGTIVDISKLLRMLEKRLRDGTVGNASRFFGGFGARPSTARYPNANGSREKDVRAYFNSSNTRITDCSGAAKLVLAKSLIDQLKPGEFDFLFRTVYGIPMEPRGVTNIDAAITGDMFAIPNDSRYTSWVLQYNSRHRSNPMPNEWSYEYVVKTHENGLFGWGFEDSRFHSYDVIRERMLAHDNDLLQKIGQPSITQLPNRIQDLQFLNVTSIADVVFEHRKAQDRAYCTCLP